MTVTVPVGPESYTTADVRRDHRSLTEDQAQHALDLAVVELNRELAGAYRTVPVVVYDDLVRRVVDAIVGVKRRPTNGGGQMGRTDQDAPAGPVRDYFGDPGVRATLAHYVAPL